jgi:hypothetical protein
MWKAQVLSALRGAQKAHFLDTVVVPPSKTIVNKEGKEESNTEYELWVAHDQQVLNLLLSTSTREILLQIASLPTAAQAWAAIEAMFASQSRARIINTRMALARRKGTPTSRTTSPR